MALPTEKRKPTPGMGKVLLYGPAKVGKSTTAATMDPDRTLLLDFEQGTSAIEAFVHPVKSWGNTVLPDPSKPADAKENVPMLAPDSFRGAIKSLATEEHEFTTVVVDTVDVAAQLAGDFVLMKLAGGNPAEYAHASDFEYGKGWSAWSEEFELRIGALCRAVPNVVFISHTDERTMTDRTGQEYTVFTPAFAPKGIRNWLTGFVDHILFAELGPDDERWLRTQPTRAYQAGGRTPQGAAKLADPLELPELNPGMVLKGALEGLAAPAEPKRSRGKGKAADAPEKDQEAAEEGGKQQELGAAA